jgi:hypothetical protein
LSSRTKLAVDVVVAALDGLLLVLFLYAPIVWILRDGLGPDMVESTGLRAAGRGLMTFYWGPVVLAVLAAETASRWWRRKRAPEPT